MSSSFPLTTNTGQSVSAACPVDLLLRDSLDVAAFSWNEFLTGPCPDSAACPVKFSWCSSELWLRNSSDPAAFSFEEFFTGPWKKIDHIYKSIIDDLILIVWHCNNCSLLKFKNYAHMYIVHWSEFDLTSSIQLLLGGWAGPAWLVLRRLLPFACASTELTFCDKHG